MNDRNPTPLETAVASFFSVEERPPTRRLHDITKHPKLGSVVPLASHDASFVDLRGDLSAAELAAELGVSVASVEAYLAQRGKEHVIQ